MKFRMVGYTIAMKLGGLFVPVAIALAIAMPVIANAQTASQNQLRATIYAEITSDPRSKDLTKAQIYSIVNALTGEAQTQGLTTSQLTYAPESSTVQSSTLTPCSDISCSISRAFGLDGTIPLIPIALFIMAALFILIYGLMREMGHPHAQT